jgi:hypothetical protein
VAPAVAIGATSISVSTTALDTTIAFRILLAPSE